jgi:DNA-binding response OmpR family regulator
VPPKTILLIDDEQGLLEALDDALSHEGYRVLKATTAERGLDILSRERVDLVTVDMMLPPGPGLEDRVSSQRTGLYICEQIVSKYPSVDVFCLSVVNDANLIKEVQKLGVRFLRKGETPLRTVLNMINSRMTGVAYSTDPEDRRMRP